ncbi:MAG: hypothetical protein IMZ44_23365 [Planctomycetes bacterium]|nr:hypothetical protein [Planctomycetota bacterium]
MDLMMDPPRELVSIASREFERLLHLRALDSTRGRPSWWRASSLVALLEGSAPWAHVVTGPCAVAPGAVFLFRSRLVDGRGGIVEDTLIPVHVEAAGALPVSAGTPAGRNARDQLADGWLPIARERARAEAAARLSSLLSQQGGGLERLSAREAAIARFLRRRLRPGAVAPAQAGLFDRRELRQAAARRLAWSRMDEMLQQRLGVPAGRPAPIAGEPELMLVLWIAHP